MFEQVIDTVEEAFKFGETSKQLAYAFVDGFISDDESV